MRAEEGGVAPALSDRILTPAERDGSKATSRDVKTLQREDDKCRAIITYITTGVMPQATKLASFVRQHAKHCIVRDDTLFKIVRLHAEAENEVELRLLWIPEACQQAYLHAFHDQLGHQGRDRTWQALRRQVYWPSSFRDVNDHVARCHECSYGKQHRSVGRSVIPAIGFYSFDLVTVDLLDMIHAECGSSKVYRKCLLFVDFLSRWVEAIPLKQDPSAVEYVQLFLQHIAAR